MTDLSVRHRTVAVIGDDVALIHSILGRAAGVTVYAPEVSASLEDLHDRGLLTWQRRHPTLDELLAADVVVNRSRAGVPDSRPADVDRGGVTLVGAGPGDPGLLTVAGQRALADADVVVTDRLVPHSTLADRPARIIDVAKIPGGRSTDQAEINRILIAEARAGHRVVRFKGGDGFVLGRGGEELQACAAAGIPVKVIPGVSSAVAAPALAGIPVTHRGLTQGFCVVSGHLPPGHPDVTTDYGALARSGLTIVVLMGVRSLAAIAQRLIDEGMAASTPVATVADGGLPSQRTIRADLATIAPAVAVAGIRPPAVTVIGEVAAFTTDLADPVPAGAADRRPIIS